jgi:hypothetical protein
MEKPGVESKAVKRPSNFCGTTIFQRLQETQLAGKCGHRSKRYTVSDSLFAETMKC